MTQDVDDVSVLVTKDVNAFEQDQKPKNGSDVETKVKVIKPLDPELPEIVDNDISELAESYKEQGVKEELE